MSLGSRQQPIISSAHLRVCATTAGALLINRFYITSVQRAFAKVVACSPGIFEIRDNEAFINNTRLPVFVGEKALNLNTLHEDGFFNIPYYYGKVDGKVLSERISNSGIVGLTDVELASFFLQFYFMLERLRLKIGITFEPANEPARYRPVKTKFLSYKGVYSKGLQVYHRTSKLPIFFRGRVISNATLDLQNKIFSDFIGRSEFEGRFASLANANNPLQMVDIFNSYGPEYAGVWEIPELLDSDKNYIAGNDTFNLSEPEVMRYLTAPDCGDYAFLLLTNENHLQNKSDVSDDPSDSTVGKDDPVTTTTTTGTTGGDKEEEYYYGGISEGPAGEYLRALEQEGVKMSNEFCSMKQPEKVFDKVKPGYGPNLERASYHGKEDRYCVKHSTVVNGEVCTDAGQEFLVGVKYINPLNKELDCFAHTVNGYVDYYRDDQVKDVPSWCSVQENVPGTPVADKMKDLSVKEYCECLAQLLMTLQYCNSKLYFTHGNLTCDNVILRPSQPEEKIEYKFPQVTVAVNSSSKVVLVDYERVYASSFDKGSSVRACESEYLHDSFRPQKSRPYNDIFKFCIDSGRHAWKNKNTQLLKVIFVLLEFFIQQGFLDSGSVMMAVTIKDMPSYLPPKVQPFEKKCTISEYIRYCQQEVPEFNSCMKHYKK